MDVAPGDSGTGSVNHGVVRKQVLAAVGSLRTALPGLQEEPRRIPRSRLGNSRAWSCKGIARPLFAQLFADIPIGALR